jgi:hypothetical protein
MPRATGLAESERSSAEKRRATLKLKFDLIRKIAPYSSFCPSDPRALCDSLKNHHFFEGALACTRFVHSSQPRSVRSSRRVEQSNLCHTQMGTMGAPGRIILP